MTNMEIFYVLKVQSWKGLKELKGRSVEEKHAGKSLGWHCSRALKGPIISNRKKSLSNSKFIWSTTTVCSSLGNQHTTLSSFKAPRRINIQGKVLPSEAGGREMSEDTWLFMLVSSSRARMMFFTWVEVYKPRYSLGNQRGLAWLFSVGIFLPQRTLFSEKNLSLLCR